MKKYFLYVLSLLLLLLSTFIVIAQTIPSVPDVPTSVMAVASDGKAIVYFNLSKDINGVPVEAYRVISVPGSYKATGSSIPIVVDGLTNGVSYTFYVTAINSFGSSVPSATSSPVIPEIPLVPVDVCSNISEVQISVPDGMQLDNSGDCVTNPTPSKKRKVSEDPSIIVDTGVDLNVSSSSINISSSTISSSTINATQNVTESIENSIGSVVDVVSNIAKAVQDITIEIAQVTETVVVNTQKYVNTPVGYVVTKTITSVSIFGSSVAAVSASFASPLTAPELFLIPMRLWGLLLTAFSLKRRNRSWGTVYDSVTKQPIDPAYVVLKDLNGKEVASSITDIDGRYGFLVGPGKYMIEAHKTNYAYPSSKLSGKLSDEMYNNLYFGSEIEVLEGGLVINKNIPLDPLRFDWNEFTKGKNKLMSFYSKKEIIFKKLSDILFEVGFIIGVLALLFAPEPYNFGIVILYLVMLVLKIFGIKTKTSGAVSNIGDGSPLSFAIIKIFSEDWNAEITKKVADKYGKYFCLLPVGKYHVIIDKKNDDESYSEIFKSPVLDIKNGILNKNFSI